MKFLNLFSLVSLAAAAALLVALSHGTANASPVAAPALRGANTTHAGLDDNSKHHYECHGCLCNSAGRCDSCCCPYDGSPLGAAFTRALFGLDVGSAVGERGDFRSFHPRDGCVATKIAQHEDSAVEDKQAKATAASERLPKQVGVSDIAKGLAQESSAPPAGNTATHIFGVMNTARTSLRALTHAASPSVPGVTPREGDLGDA